MGCVCFASGLSIQHFNGTDMPFPWANILLRTVRNDSPMPLSDLWGAPVASSHQCFFVHRITGFFLFTGSQKAWDGKRHLEVIWPNLLAWAEPPRVSCPDSIPGSFWISLRVETTTSPGKLCQCSVTHTVKKFVPIASGPGTGYHIK